MTPQKTARVFQEKSGLVLIILAVLLAKLPESVKSEPSAEGRTGGSGGGDGDSEFSASSSLIGSPKRQYLIAPRVGRSVNQVPQANFWSALEEATFSLPAQANQHQQSPIRAASLMFLINNQPNRRLIGPRSGGLLPQARIGRRSAPIGLMPQPRVGRRSNVGLGFEEQAADLEPQENSEGGQREVAVTTLSDSSAFNDALESFLSVLASCELPANAAPALERSSADIQTTIERPTHRATSFVPRLGKRDEQDLERTAFEKLLCNNYGLDCERLVGDLNQRDSPLVSMLLRGIGATAANSRQQPPRFVLRQEALNNLANAENQIQLEQQQQQANDLDILDLMAQQLKRETRASEEIQMTSSANTRGGGGKRVAFTPRIG